MENKADKNKIIKPRITTDFERKRRRSESYQKYNSKTKIVNFRLTNEEYLKYLEQAEKLSFRSIGSYAKEKFLYRSNSPFLPKVDKVTIMAINKIGINVNQITKSLNTYKSKAEIGNLIYELKNIKSELQSILKILNRDCKA